MTRETVEAKAARYLTEGRIVVTSVSGDLVTATCRGQGEQYDLGHDPARGWWCSCPVRTDRHHPAPHRRPSRTSEDW